MARLLTIINRSAILRVAGGALMAAVETGIFSLALLMMIVSAGEVALFPDTLGRISANMMLFGAMFAVMLPHALLVALVALWPIMMAFGGLLIAGARFALRLSIAPVWIAAGIMIGLALGALVFIGGRPQFDIVEGRWAPVAALLWTATSGAFAGWRLHRKLVPR